MGNLLLGIDIGTSACKVAAFKLDGTVVARASESYAISHPQPGWAEQSPDQWWSGVQVAIHRLLSNGIRSSDIAAIGVDGQSWSAVAVDENGNVLCPTPIWMDTRATAQCDHLAQRCGEESLFQLNGNPIQPTYTMPKVLWYKEHCPDVYRRASKILQSNSYIVFCLTGVMTQDPSQGYGWNCFDIEKGIWNADMCSSAGVNPHLLPDVMPSHAVVGKVTQSAAALTGLLEGTPVVAGGLDAACGALGAGVLSPGQVQEQGGQAGGMSICMDECIKEKSLILSKHVAPGLWLLQGGTVGGCGALNWFEREFCVIEHMRAKENKTTSFIEIDIEAQSIPPGSHGLVFLPYLAGERSPIWSKHAKGVFYGIQFATSRAHFARAVMEGVAYSLRHNLEKAERAGVRIQTLRAMGGAANSLLWTQMKADVTNKRIEVPATDTATALGAALLAGIGIGAYDSFPSAISNTVKLQRLHLPDATRQSQYERGYRTYRALYEALKMMMEDEKLYESSGTPWKCGSSL